MCVLLATEITWQYDLNRKLWACFSAKKSCVFVVNHGSHIGCHNACRWLSLLYSFPDGILTSYSFTCYGTLLGITQTCYAARSSSQNRVLYGEVCMHRTHQPHHVSIIRPGLSTEGIQSDRNVFAVCTLSVNLMCVGNSWAVLLQGWGVRRCSESGLSGCLLTPSWGGNVTLRLSLPPPLPLVGLRPSTWVQKTGNKLLWPVPPRRGNSGVELSQVAKERWPWKCLLWNGWPTTHSYRTTSGLKDQCPRSDTVKHTIFQEIVINSNGFAGSVFLRT